MLIHSISVANEQARIYLSRIISAEYLDFDHPLSALHNIAYEPHSQSAAHPTPHREPTVLISY